MNKRKINITALITVVVILLVSLCAGAVSLIVEDSMFKNNTPTYITPNSQTTGIIKNADESMYRFAKEEFKKQIYLSVLE